MIQGCRGFSSWHQAGWLNKNKTSSRNKRIFGVWLQKGNQIYKLLPMLPFLPCANLNHPCSFQSKTGNLLSELRIENKSPEHASMKKLLLFAVICFSLFSAHAQETRFGFK